MLFTVSTGPATPAAGPSAPAPHPQSHEEAVQQREALKQGITRHQQLLGLSAQEQERQAEAAGTDRGRWRDQQMEAVEALSRELRQLNAWLAESNRQRNSGRKMVRLDMVSPAEASAREKRAMDYLFRLLTMVDRHLFLGLAGDEFQGVATAEELTLIDDAAEFCGWRKVDGGVHPGVTP